MAKDKYVAYVSTYTINTEEGIRVYDVDMENGRFTEKDKIKITNSSYISLSHNKKYLFSITDFGVESYKILPNGGLELINFASINGMRGCYVSSDYTDSYLFVAGYHDGKLTVLKINEDGSIGNITDEIYHKALGSLSEKNSRPHINCARMTHDNKYLLVSDQGMDHVNVYKLNTEYGKLKLVDVIRSEIESAPRHIKISQDGRFIYIVHEWKCFIDVYQYEEKGDMPYFTKTQTVTTTDKEPSQGITASALSFSADYDYVVSSNAGDNTVIIYDVDKETGNLTKNLCLPISGEYPKDAEMFPNDKYLVSLNHESNTLTFFTLDLVKKVMYMNGKPIKIPMPNCIVFHKISE